MNTEPWEIIREIYERKIPFHGLLGLKVIDLQTDSPKIVIEHSEEFVGNFIRGNLHGGVISSLLDVVGGAVAFVDIVRRKKYDSSEQMLEQFSKMGTIDLRIDYLRPGFGKRFIASAYVLRAGNKVAVTRMELHNDEDTLVAVGTGAYIVG